MTCEVEVVFGVDDSQRPHGGEAVNFLDGDSVMIAKFLLEHAQPTIMGSG